MADVTESHFDALWLCREALFWCAMALPKGTLILRYDFARDTLLHYNFAEMHFDVLWLCREARWCTMPLPRVARMRYGLPRRTLMRCGVAETGEKQFDALRLCTLLRYGFAERHFALPIEEL